MTATEQVDALILGARRDTHVEYVQCRRRHRCKYLLVLFAIHYELCSFMQTNAFALGANRTYKYLEDYLVLVQSKGRYAVTLEELKGEFDISEKALLQSLFRLKTKRQLAQVRKEFYVIIPPHYSERGMVPPSLFIDDMMDYLGKDYYVGLLSAAALHGAAHQQPMEFQVITKAPALRSIKNQQLSVRFFTKSEWDPEQIEKKKTETGYLHLSTPELTAFDLVNYHKSIGGLNRILPILEELAESMKSSRLKKAAKHQKIPTIQRLGCLLEVLEITPLANALQQMIPAKGLKGIPLSLAHRKKDGPFNEKWSVFLNAELDL